MIRRTGLLKTCGLIVLASLSTTARADSLVLVTSQAGQGANDSVQWSQLGADGTTLGSTSSATSMRGSTVTLSLTGPSSLVSVVCPASPCSWAGTGLTAADTLIWTSDTGNGGNGPLTLTFGRGISGVGALIQADGPGQFTAQIQVLNGATSLGSFTQTSSANGDATYIGVLDQSGANITSVVFSLTTCAATCTNTDFAIDTVNLVTAPATQVSLLSSPNPSTLGQSVTFTATVTPASGTGSPTGTVTFHDGATVLGTGSLVGGFATFMTSGLGGGAHSITAVYGGDANFGGGSSPVLMQTVNKAASSTSVTSSNNSSNRGAPVTFTATVTSSATGSTPTGTVTFQDGSTLLGTGTLSSARATFTTSGLMTGPHSITAVYGGDASFTGSTSAVLTQTIGKAVSSTSVSSSNNPSNLGAAVTLTATVTSPVGGPPPTGMITLHDGASQIGAGTLSGGTATFTTSALTAGTHSITAIYGGDGNFAGGTSPIFTQTVNKVGDSASVSSSNNPSIFGTAVTFTATVRSSATGTPSGMITFQDGAATLGTGMLSGGTATFTTSGLMGGAHSITAVYAGDATFAGSTSTALTQTVADFSLSASPATTTVTAGSTATYMVTVNPTGGFNQTILFKCSGAPMTAVCTAPPSVSATGGSYASFNVTVSTMSHSLAPPGVALPFSGSGSRIMLEWLLALAACGILSGVAASGRSRGWRVSSVAMLVLLVCAGCATTQNGGNSPPISGTAPGTYSLNLAGSSGSLSNSTMLTLTVK